MKKFLSISMMALALVFASSCNKDENGEPSAEKCVNTWVTDEVALSEVVGKIDLGDVKLPEEILAALAPQLNNFKARAAVELAADGKGKGGILVEKAQLNLMMSAVQALLTQYGSQLDPEVLAEVNAVLTKVKPMLDNLKDGDLVGATFTYTATATDAENGKITVTYKSTDENGNEKDETTEVAYSGLSDDAITLVVADEDGTQTVPLKSASSAKVTVGNFVDATALKALFGE